MKKTYISPELDVVKIMTTGMLATSSLTVSDSTVDEINDLLAPEMPELDNYFSSDDLDGFFGM